MHEGGEEIELVESAHESDGNHSTPGVVPEDLEMGNNGVVVDMGEYTAIEHSFVEVDLGLPDFGFDVGVLLVKSGLLFNEGL